MSREAELELYREWDRQLSHFFERLHAMESAEEEPSVEDTSRTSLYRRRVEQDLTAFQQKLSNIMEREKRGQ